MAYKLSLKYSIFMFWSDLSWHFSTWRPPRNQVLKTRFWAYKPSLKDSIFMFWSDLSWHFFTWHPPRNQVLETQFMSIVIFKCLESSIALPKKVQLIIYICKTFIVIFKCLESSITLPKKVQLIIFLSYFHSKFGQSNWKVQSSMGEHWT